MQREIQVRENDHDAAFKRRASGAYGLRSEALPPSLRAPGPGDHLPDAGLLDRFGASRAIRERIVPWRRAGAVTVVVATDPATAEMRRTELERIYGPVSVALAEPAFIEHAVLSQRRAALTMQAEVRTDKRLSCRALNSPFNRALLTLFAGAAVLLVALFPAAALALSVVWASAWLFLATLLRLAALFAAGRQRIPVCPPPPESLPRISCLIPLFRERDIAEHLVSRLSALNYPTDKLEIILIIEKHDAITRAALLRCDLPGHMRVISVPPGRLQTKPRAMNYALDFTQGDIVGIYDAEDAPEPEQLRQVAAHFAAAGRDVACLQGRLDFYNPAANWLSRAFTVDYAVWFRVILPGLARLGLVVPLGGTTLFFRREVLEKLGAWDAHNVTEDADLGVRLARHGWRTEVIPTETLEEANCRLWPWVRQRSRWIKGYAMTWAVHMREPRTLWSDLGPWRFAGMQIVFLGSLSQVLFAPVLWSFWLVFAGLEHPLSAFFPQSAMLALATLFLAAELTNIGIGAWACRDEKHRWLIPWVPTLHFYFPLAAIAAWKGFSEIVSKPFFWDKTEHGQGQ